MVNKRVSQPVTTSSAAATTLRFINIISNIRLTEGTSSPSTRATAPVENHDRPPVNNDVLAVDDADWQQVANELALDSASLPNIDTDELENYLETLGGDANGSAAPATTPASAITPGDQPSEVVVVDAPQRVSSDEIVVNSKKRTRQLEREHEAMEGDVQGAAEALRLAEAHFRVVEDDLRRAEDELRRQRNLRRSAETRVVECRQRLAELQGALNTTKAKRRLIRRMFLE